MVDLENALLATKRTLDHAEFVERVPALQRLAAEYEMIEGVASLPAIDHMGRSSWGDSGFDESRIVLPAIIVPGPNKVYKLNDRGAKILKFPRHPAVIAYARELANKYTKRFRAMCEFDHVAGADLRTARRRLKDAFEIFHNRVNFRNVDVEWKDGGLSVGLASILEARAEAMFWRKIVRNLEYFAEIERSNKRNKVKPQEYVTIGGEVYPVSQ